MGTVGRKLFLFCKSFYMGKIGNSMAELRNLVVSSLAVPGSIPLRMSTVAIKIYSVSISKK